MNFLKFTTFTFLLAFVFSMSAHANGARGPSSNAQNLSSAADKSSNSGSRAVTDEQLKGYILESVMAIARPLVGSGVSPWTELDGLLPNVWFGANIYSRWGFDLNTNHRHRFLKNATLMTLAEAIFNEMPE